MNESSLKKENLLKILLVIVLLGILICACLGLSTVLMNAANRPIYAPTAITNTPESPINPKPINTNPVQNPTNPQPTTDSSPIPGDAQPTLTNTPQPVNTQPIVVPSNTPNPTNTKRPNTNTPNPSNTASPSNTLRPTNTRILATRTPSQTTIKGTLTRTRTLVPTYPPRLTNTPGPSPTTWPQLFVARKKIKHIIIIMQENRSFDHYFGTFPGADGIPMVNGVPTVCLMDPKTNICEKPYHDPNDINYGGPHGRTASNVSVNGGKMDGFIKAFRDPKLICVVLNSPNCVLDQAPDVMGWHDAREIPNYWAYARNFVLQDRMFEPTNSWSLTSHLFMVSGWSANCTEVNQPFSCTNAPDGPSFADFNAGKGIFAWTDITYLLHKANVSWAYYLSEGIEPDCADDAAICEPVEQNLWVPGIWNPLPRFDTVRENDQLGNIQLTERYFEAAANGTLPAVSWIIPNNAVSEHPKSSVHAGEAYVTSLVNAAMQGPDWESTAIFISWDDWGGFYDHVVPPVVDINGYGIRVPGLMISPYAKRGYIDHQTLSFDAYLKLIEDIFLNGQRINPRNIDRPDPRPTVRESLRELGNLLYEFDFTQPPRPPFILPVDRTLGPVFVKQP